MVTRVQDFVMPSFKISDNKVEVLSTVSKSPPNPSTLNQQINQHALNRDELFALCCLFRTTRRYRNEIEKSIASNNKNTSSSTPQLDSHGVMHPSSSATPGVILENLLYGMPPNFFPGQTPPVQPPKLSTAGAVRPVLATGLTTALEDVLEQPVPLAVVPSSATPSRTNVLENCVPLYNKQCIHCHHLILYPTMFLSLIGSLKLIACLT